MTWSAYAEQRITYCSRWGTLSRYFANKLGYSLSEYGLKACVRHRDEGGNTAHTYYGTSVPARCEREIFAALGLPYRPPHDRWTDGDREPSQPRTQSDADTDLVGALAGSKST